MGKIEQLNERIESWAESRGILDRATPLAQAEKTQEEVSELMESCIAQANDKTTYTNSKGETVNTLEQIMDDIGDIYVTIAIQARLQGVSIEECIEKSVKIIEARTGKMVNGKFVKDK